MSATLAILKGAKSAPPPTGKPVLAVVSQPVPEPDEAPFDGPADLVEKASAPAPAKAKTLKGKKGTAVATASLSGDVMGPDPIQSASHEIENLKDAATAVAMAKKTGDDAGFGVFRLGGLLSVIQQKKWFEPHETFRAFVEAEFPIKYRKAMYLIDIYRKLVDGNIPWDAVKAVGWTKLMVMIDVVDKDNVGEWSKLAVASTTLKLQGLVNDAKKGSKKDIDPSAVISSISTLTVKLGDDQKENVKAAIAKAKKEMGDEAKSDGFALEMIALDFLGSQTAVSPPVASQAPKSLKDALRDLLAQEPELVDFLTAVEEVCLEVNPNLVFDVTEKEDGTEV